MTHLAHPVAPHDAHFLLFSESKGCFMALTHGRAACIICHTDENKYNFTMDAERGVCNGCKKCKCSTSTCGQPSNIEFCMRDERKTTLSEVTVYSFTLIRVNVSISPVPRIRDAKVGFYRAMHFSAKRGLAIACRPSVRLSVCPSVTLVDCDHIG